VFYIIYLSFWGIFYIHIDLSYDPYGHHFGQNYLLILDNLTYIYKL